jgi:acetyl-CoA carboxylase biotin carboxyl carrier protein
MIDISYLEQLLEIFDKSTANDLRIEQEGTSIKLSKVAPRRDDVTMQSMPSFAYPQMQMQMAQAPAAAPAPVAAPVAASEPAATNGAAAVDTKKYHEIRSPIVGTFYRASAPDSPSFTEAGQDVSPGQVLCIIEAMKLMNEIECDVYGKVVKILVENAQPVEYNQVLFLIDPS